MPIKTFYPLFQKYRVWPFVKHFLIMIWLQKKKIETTEELKKNQFFLKLTIGKIITSIIATILFFLLINFRNIFILCSMCAQIIYEKWPDIIGTPCSCIAGAPFFEFVIEIIIAFVLPFVGIYLLYSFYYFCNCSLLVICRYYYRKFHQRFLILIFIHE